VPSDETLRGPEITGLLLSFEVVPSRGCAKIRPGLTCRSLRFNLPQRWRARAYGFEPRCRVRNRLSGPNSGVFDIALPCREMRRTGPSSGTRQLASALRGAPRAAQREPLLAAAMHCGRGFATIACTALPSTRQICHRHWRQFQFFFRCETVGFRTRHCTRKREGGSDCSLASAGEIAVGNVFLMLVLPLDSALSSGTPSSDANN